MGRGAIVIGLAAVIIGEVLLGKVFRNFALKLLSAVIGSIIYYIVLQFVLRLGLESTDLKLLSAVVVALALAGVAEELLAFLEELAAGSGVPPDLFTPLYKTIGIALVVQVGGNLCRDAGESALASVVETAGTLCALLAALVTGADSFILQGSSNLTHDFYRQLINPKATNKQLMFWSRLTVLIIALGALIVAFNFTGIIAIYQWALRLTATTIVLPFLATMLWRGVTKTGAMSGMLLGLVSTLVWPYLGISFDQTFFGFIFCAIGLFGGSLLTRHAPEENVAAVLWEDLPTATERQ